MALSHVTQYLIHERVLKMRILILFLTLCAFSMLLSGQETRLEKLMPSVTTLDKDPNNDTVPAGYAITGNFRKVLIFRFKYQTDLLTGIDSLVGKESIRNGVILAGIGSVRNYRFHTVSNRTLPSTDVFVSSTDGPADIASMNGYIINGRVHAHITFSDSTHAFGGHLEEGTNVFTFAIITVGVLDDAMDIRRVDDKTFR